MDVVTTTTIHEMETNTSVEIETMTETIIETQDEKSNDSMESDEPKKEFEDNEIEEGEVSSNEEEVLPFKSCDVLDMGHDAKEKAETHPRSSSSNSSHLRQKTKQHFSKGFIAMNLRNGEPMGPIRVIRSKKRNLPYSSAYSSAHSSAYSSEKRVFNNERRNAHRPISFRDNDFNNSHRSSHRSNNHGHFIRHTIAPIAPIFHAPAAQNHSFPSFDAHSSLPKPLDLDYFFSSLASCIHGNEKQLDLRCLPLLPLLPRFESPPILPHLFNPLFHPLIAPYSVSPRLSPRMFS